MVVRYISNIYNLLLSLGAFYMGISMFLERGAFDTFPQEWIGVLPFNNWASLALFGIIVFGIGNGIVSIYGFVKKDKNIFILTLTMGALFLLCTIIPTNLLGEWYLPTSFFLVFSVIQLLLGLFGLLNYYYFSKISFKETKV